MAAQAPGAEAAWAKKEAARPPWRIESPDAKLGTAHATSGWPCFRDLVTDLLRYEKIRTTEAKAKEVRGMAEKMITLGKQGSLHARRQVLRFVTDKDVVEKVFDELAPRYADRTGGYTRIVKLGPRQGDGAAWPSSSS